mgnify:CR=1 FL=1
MSLVSVKTSGNEYKHVHVEEDVYFYIKQLENAVKYKDVASKLKQAYPDRFQ